MILLDLPVERGTFDAQDRGRAAFVPAGGVQGGQDVPAFDIFQRLRLVPGTADGNVDRIPRGGQAGEGQVGDVNLLALCQDDGPFDDVLRFRTKIIAYDGNARWVEPTLMETAACLALDAPPAPDPECEYCGYAARMAEYAAGHGPSEAGPA